VVRLGARRFGPISKLAGQPDEHAEAGDLSQQLVDLALESPGLGGVGQRNAGSHQLQANLDREVRTVPVLAGGGLARSVLASIRQ
jgi:hypothetical protein